MHHDLHYSIVRHGDMGTSCERDMESDRREAERESHLLPGVHRASSRKPQQDDGEGVFWNSQPFCILPVTSEVRSMCDIGLLYHAAAMLPCCVENHFKAGWTRNDT
jgi:hypothetical protein